MAEKAQNDNNILKHPHEHINGEIIPFASEEFAKILIALAVKYPDLDIIKMRKDISGDNEADLGKRKASLFVVRTKTTEGFEDVNLLGVDQLIGIRKQDKPTFLRDILGDNIKPKPIPVRVYFNTDDTINRVVPKLPPEKPKGP